MRKIFGDYYEDSEGGIILPSANGDLMMARGTERDIFGKLEVNLVLRMPRCVMEDAVRRANKAEVGLSNYVRSHIYVGIYGVSHIESLRHKQFHRVIGNASGMHNIPLPPLAGE